MAVVLIILEIVRIRHVLVGALSVMDADDSKEELAVCAGIKARCSQPRSYDAHPYSGVSITSALACVPSEKRKLPQYREPTEGCPQKEDTLFDRLQNVGRLVDTPAQVPKMNRWSVPLSCYLDDERRGKS